MILSVQCKDRVIGDINMNYAIILRPLIGAGIGYVTNWIAVKMMFRPLKPIKIGKWNLPFTPGIIPKNKERIAKSIGNSVGAYLLTEEVLSQNLLSDESKEKIKNKINKILNELAENDETIENNLCKLLDSSIYEKSTQYINEKLTENIIRAIKEANISKLIAEQIEISATEKIKGSMIGMFGGNSLVAKISEESEKRINDYIDENGNELVSNIVNSEIEKVSNTQVSTIMLKVSETEIDITQIILNIYEKIILEKLADMLKVVNISKVVENNINSMDMLDLEKIILNIMKKELNALVNLGAIIGFILGLLNLLI